jgi:hypothetical protein
MRENAILNSHENKREQMVFAGYDYSSPSYLVYNRLNRRFVYRAHEEVRLDERRPTDKNNLEHKGVTQSYRKIRVDEEEDSNRPVRLTTPTRHTHT